MIKKALIGIGSVAVIGTGTFMLGPVKSYEPVPDPLIELAPLEVSSVDSILEAQEALVSDLKNDNQARVIWYDSVGQKTDFSLVYIHGFSASQMEGDPIHKTFAKRYGMNAYLHRLADHGRKSDRSFEHLTPGQLVASAQEAIRIGKSIGNKVIVMSCSTGSTLSAYLASENQNEIYAQIMYSPNIDLEDPAAELLLQPWGENILKMVSGGEYRQVQYDTIAPKYWNKTYHINGAMVVKHLIHQTMKPEIWNTIKQPLFLGYYYKDEAHKDDVVSVDAMLTFGDAIGTPQSQKRIVAFPEVGYHVMSSWVFSEDLLSVQRETFDFAEDILGLNPIVE